MLNPSKKAIVNRLRKAASKSDEIVLATDGDREGEAISWHLLQVGFITRKAFLGIGSSHLLTSYIPTQYLETLGRLYETTAKRCCAGTDP